jgi:predicted metal-dependent phosphoesterase TrpH
LSIIAITDHDSLIGIEPALLAAESFPALKVIPGLEINTDIPNAEVHILGYFINYRDDELNQSLRRQRDSREFRAQKILGKLGNLGIDIEWNHVLELASDGAVGRPHIARAMLEQGYVTSMQEAFNMYIGRQGPAYVERARLSPQEATELMVKAGGLPVLAHPADLDNIEEFLIDLKEVGLVGLEAYYSRYDKKTIQRLVDLANKHGLITSGGSDFHGFGDDKETPMGAVDVPFDCAERLIALAEQRAHEVIKQ